ncbi:hypothetical protein BN11_350013 [Nostocoides australiense Ben110]|uniref:Uncharacterized protein n=1 Tax=Nostocoides australiense Ben110 TaxID=1193182 RepID=W6JYX6_9MICO|nr:hypothetical protein BN11_350013 [Tetrasphaera australiensis Ben110]
MAADRAARGRLERPRRADPLRRRRPPHSRGRQLSVGHDAADTGIPARPPAAPKPEGSRTAGITPCDLPSKAWLARGLALVAGAMWLDVRAAPRPLDSARTPGR